MQRIEKLRLSRETVRRLAGVARDAQAVSAARCNTDAYSFCTPCPESVDVCGLV